MLAAMCLLLSGSSLLTTGCGDAETSASDANETTTTGEGSSGSPLGSGLPLEPTPLGGTEVVVRGDLDGAMTDGAGNALGTDAATGIQSVVRLHGHLHLDGR